jgi:hypothetical protein
MTGWVERYYGWLALILVAIVVGATCWPVIVYPQLDPDEYRYLALLQAAGDAAGSAGDAAAGWMERALVENRWDHLWWIADRDPVRFWRPTVLASFAVDRAIWGREGVEFGLCLSNVLIYTSMCLVFAAVLGRAFGRSWTSLVALGLFAAFFAHGEAIWYVSGRNETIAGFFALLAWWLHLRGGLWRYGGALAFLLALMTKELVIGLPLLLLVQEAWLRREELGESDGAGADAVAQRWSGLLRAAWPWLLAYGAAVLLWFRVAGHGARWQERGGRFVSLLHLAAGRGIRCASVGAAEDVFGEPAVCDRDPAFCRTRGARGLWARAVANCGGSWACRGTVGLAAA